MVGERALLEKTEGVEMKGAWLEKCEPPSPRIHFHTSTPSKSSRCDRPTDRPTDRPPHSPPGDRRPRSHRRIRGTNGINPTN